MINLKQEKGVTMIALIVTVIIILIVTNILVYNAQDTIHIQTLTNLHTDIELLRDKVSEYYNEYGAIPAKIEYKNNNQLNNLSDVLSSNNDTGRFFIIDLEAMEGITLNFGKDYQDIKDDNEITDIYDGDKTDLYIINENSHNIFHVGGIIISNNGETKTYYTDYTEPDNTVADLKYVEGIMIPDGYYYIGKHSDGVDSEVIVISSNRDEEINATSETQYIWQKQLSLIDRKPNSIVLSESQDEDEFIKSVNYYKGYFKNKNKISNIDVVYVPIVENKWSEPYTENGKYTDKNGNTAFIPKGYRVSLAEGTNEISKGLVITSSIDNQTKESNGNEFVWVPVDYFGDFVRGDFGAQGITSAQFIKEELDNPAQGTTYYYEKAGDGRNIDNNGSEDLLEAQSLYKSVKENKGFYIGRYETGITTDTARGSGSSKQDAVIKKNKIIYNYVTFEETANNVRNGALEIARDMHKTISGDSNTAYQTTLCYGVQWDAVMRWINSDTSINTILTDSSGYGNYDQSGDLIKSGANEKYQIKNIYDMAGNVGEWTMEQIYGTNKRVIRGGKSGTADPMTKREEKEVSTNKSDLGPYGFRVALFIK